MQNQKLTIPIRIRLDDDDTGICATCLEIPQVYGFGENKNEALSMLDREILSLYTDIQEDIPLSDEYRLLKEHLDLLLRFSTFRDRMPCPQGRVQPSLEGCEGGRKTRRSVIFDK